MKQRYFFFLLALILTLPSWAFSTERVRVLILPFEIFSPEDRSQLKTEIPNVIARQLEDAGAHIVNVPKEVSLTEGFEGIGQIRQLGSLSGADQVIWGSLTWIGKKFSLDVKMLETFSHKAPEIFYQEGDGPADLSLKLQKLSQEIGIKLFKQQRVVEISVEGNNRIETDAIKRLINTKVGDIFSAGALSQDLKSVFDMGFFDDVRVETEDTPAGKEIIFNVKEKPTVRVIRVEGNKVFKDDEIRENMDIRTGSILNLFRINSNVQRIETIYREKNYHNVNVTYEIDELDNNQADLTFIIDEGDKIRIKSIVFEGNETYSEKKLKSLMKTSEKGFFSWLTSSGDLNKEDLNQDAARLQAFYQNNGFVQARVGEPQIEFLEDRIGVTIKIDEGPQYKVGAVDLRGDLVLPPEELMEKVKIAEQEYYNREVVRNDVMALTDMYSDEGYAYADIAPIIEKNDETLTVDIAYAIKKGKQVYFEEIIITGNTRTRDKVIRRELMVHEHDLYSGRLLKRSMRNIFRLDYFDDVKLDTIEGSTDDSMILKIDVQEKHTGAFSFGGGYSSIENMFVMGAISQRNLFGRGQILELKASLGGASTRYTLSFTEPWLFDIPLSFGIDLYDWERDYDEYDKDARGGGVRLSYPIFDYTRVYLNYKYEDAKITDIVEDASNTIKELEGENTESAVSASIRYDSRDKRFNPTEGQNHAFTFEYSGIGGDIGFIKYTGELGVYFPLFWETVGFIHGEGGYMKDISGKLVPDYEKFYLGGIDSMRGFDWRDIYVPDEEGAKTGGFKYVQLNLEYIFPVAKKAGLMGVIFYDTGNVYGKDESVDLGNLRESAGAGFRWYSPLGPIRIEYGYILDPTDEDDDRGQWEFSMGGGF
jgi:outer membrane protein insertion porin family